MIQDSDIEVLDKVYYTPITPELVMREGFEIKKQVPSIRDIHYVHKELDIELIQYDHHNLVVAKSGYPYAYTVKFITPAPVPRNPYNLSETHTNIQTNTFNYSIYTYGQLLAIIEAKARLNDLQMRIKTEVEDIVFTVYLANKYKTSK